jgi:hypothetical protein
MLPSGRRGGARPLLKRLKYFLSGQANALAPGCLPSTRSGGPRPGALQRPEPVGWLGFPVSCDRRPPAGVAQQAEHPPCKRTVSGSIPLTGSILELTKNPHLPAGMGLFIVLVAVAVHCLSVRFVDRGWPFAAARRLHAGPPGSDGFSEEWAQPIAQRRRRRSSRVPGDLYPSPVGFGECTSPQTPQVPAWGVTADCGCDLAAVPVALVAVLVGAAAGDAGIGCGPLRTCATGDSFGHAERAAVRRAA